MKSKDLYNNISRELQNVYDPPEAQSMAIILLEEYFELKRSDLLLDRDADTNAELDLKLLQAVNRIKNHEPIQYVLGKAHFYGRDFKVDYNVLIPRRETEELVHLIINENPNFRGSILDIGTGSGCIPITLDLEIPQSSVASIDISEGALGIAKRNANELKADIEFHQFDILSSDALPNQYDIIVSNPPYVTTTEKKLMRDNVLNHEPHLALFVADDDPLLFYNVIIKKATDALKQGGRLYFEINEQFGEELADRMKEYGFRNVIITKDMQGKDRIVSGSII